MELNVTYIVLDGYIHIEKYRAIYFIFFLSAFVIIISTNSTIVWIVFSHKNLHEPMYFFIAALLLNSIVFSVVLYPKILLDILSERQVVAYSTCLFQWYILYAVQGAELWLLMMMAFDRYLAICKPLQYATVMTKSKVRLLLAVAWTVPAFQMAIIISLTHRRKMCSLISRGIICNSTILKLSCVQSDTFKKGGFIIFIYLILMPVIFNCFTYIHIFTIANRGGVEMRKKAMRTCLPHLVILFNYTCLSTFDGLLARTDGEFPKIGLFIMNLQLILYHPLFNPFIYGLKMRKISIHLRRLFSAEKHVK